MAPNKVFDKLKEVFKGKTPSPAPVVAPATPALGKPAETKPAEVVKVVTPAPAAPVVTTPPLTKAQLETAIAKYGPIISLHPDEKYFPTSIEYYLSHSVLVDSSTKPPTRLEHPTSSQLPTGAKEGTRYELLVDDVAKEGDFTQAKAYVNAFWKEGMSYTDIQFWIFSGFNGHATASFKSFLLNKVEHAGNVDLSPLGEHWADWEYVAIRIDNMTQGLIGLMLSAHGKDVFFDTTKPEIKSKFTWTEETHPVMYSSLNGHANFPGVGDNFTETRKVPSIPFGLEFDLMNTTAAGGKECHTSAFYEVVNVPWLPTEYPVPNWVKYMYRWGPEGTSITMDTKTLGEFLMAALGPDASPLLKDPVVLLASWLLHVFVKQDMNGAGAPAGQNPWLGNYA